MNCPLVGPLRLPLLALSVAFAAVPAQAQVEQEPDMEEIATTPLRDLNIVQDDVPEALKVAVRNPYEIARLTSCDAIVADIAAIDQVLGADYDLAEPSEDEDGFLNIKVGTVGQSVVASLIPFRGILREVTGAADNDRAERAAYTAGMARRAFLKGVGLGRGCTYPASPKAR